MTPEAAAAAVAAVREPRLTVAAWACFQSGRMLVVRPHGVPVWFLPGGLVEPGESLAQAAAREAFEEVGVAIEPADLEPWTVVVAPAHGAPELSVALAVHVGRHTGKIEPLDEIGEIGWITAAERADCASAIQLVLDEAVADGYVEGL